MDEYRDIIHITQLDSYIKRMKCCGNCKQFYNDKASVCQYHNKTSGFCVCDKWEHDNKEFINRENSLKYAEKYE